MAFEKLASSSEQDLEKFQELLYEPKSSLNKAITWLQTIGDERAKSVLHIPFECGIRDVLKRSSLKEAKKLFSLAEQIDAKDPYASDSIISNWCGQPKFLSYIMFCNSQPIADLMAEYFARAAERREQEGTSYFNTLWDSVFYITTNFKDDAPIILPVRAFMRALAICRTPEQKGKLVNRFAESYLKFHPLHSRDTFNQIFEELHKFELENPSPTKFFDIPWHFKAAMEMFAASPQKLLRHSALLKFAPQILGQNIWRLFDRVLPVYFLEWEPNETLDSNYYMRNIYEIYSQELLKLHAEKMLEVVTIHLNKVNSLGNVERKGTHIHLSNFMLAAYNYKPNCGAALAHALSRTVKYLTEVQDISAVQYMIHLMKLAAINPTLMQHTLVSDIKPINALAIMSKSNDWRFFIGYCCLQPEGVSLSFRTILDKSPSKYLEDLFILLSQTEVIGYIRGEFGVRENMNPNKINTLLSIHSLAHRICTERASVDPEIKFDNHDIIRVKSHSRGSCFVPSKILKRNISSASKEFSSLNPEYVKATYAFVARNCKGTNVYALVWDVVRYTLEHWSLAEMQQIKGDGELKNWQLKRFHVSLAPTTPQELKLWSSSRAPQTANCAALETPENYLEDCIQRAAEALLKFYDSPPHFK